MAGEGGVIRGKRHEDVLVGRGNVPNGALLDALAGARKSQTLRIGSIRKPPLGWVKIYTEVPKGVTLPRIMVLARLDEGVANLSGGYGGFETIDRPRRKASTEFAGSAPFEMNLPILLDAFLTQRSIEPEITSLEKMALAHQGSREPPVVRVLGAVPGTGLKWHIQDIQWGDKREGNTKGKRVRQDAVLTLQQAIDEVLIPNSPAAKFKETGGVIRGGTTNAGSSIPAGGGFVRGSSKIYVVQEDDTLTSIALRQLGDRNYWKTIAQLNGIRDPRKITHGQKLRLP